METFASIRSETRMAILRQSVQNRSVRATTQCGSHRPTPQNLGHRHSKGLSLGNANSTVTPNRPNELETSKNPFDASAIIKEIDEHCGPSYAIHFDPVSNSLIVDHDASGHEKIVNFLAKRFPKLHPSDDSR